MKIYFLNILCLISIITFGQDSSVFISTSQKINYTKYSLKERGSFYPFKKSSKILIVVFDKQTKELDSTDWRFGKAAFKEFKNIKYGLPLLNDTVCFSKLMQVKELAANEIETLTDILYNTCFRWTITEETKAACYLPHNAILFLNNKNKLIGYIEICFSCRQIRYSDKRIERFLECDFAIDALKTYFQKFNFKTTMEEF